MKSKRILIAHQDNDSATSLIPFFRDLGYGVEEASDVGGVLRRIRNDRLPVVLVDDQVEEVKAWELVPLIKQINPRIQIIVISSEGSIERMKLLRRTGIFYLAMKPVDLEEAGAAVRCAFEKVEREMPKESFLSLFLPQLLPA